MLVVWRQRDTVKVPYSGKLSREKILRIGYKKYDFCGENFRGLLTRAVSKNTTPPISWRNFRE